MTDNIRHVTPKIEDIDTSKLGCLMAKTDTPNQHTAPTAVNQRLIKSCPACGKGIIAQVYLTFTAGTDVAYHEKSFTTTGHLVGLSVAHDCSPKMLKEEGPETDD